MLPRQNKLQRFHKAPPRREKGAHSRNRDRQKKSASTTAFGSTQSDSAKGWDSAEVRGMWSKNASMTTLSMCRADTTPKNNMATCCTSTRYTGLPATRGRIMRPCARDIQNRHSPEFLSGTLTRLQDGEYLIESDTKVQGIAPGQYGVIYDRSSKICFGSGIITGRQINHTHSNQTLPL